MPKTIYPHPPQLLEKQVQRYAVDLLKQLGCTVFSTSQARRSKVSVALPDLFIRKPKWPVGVWVAIEMKGDKTPISTEQRELALSGAIHLCRGMDGVESLPKFIKICDENLAKKTKRPEEVRTT